MRNQIFLFFLLKKWRLTNDKTQSLLLSRFLFKFYTKTIRGVIVILSIFRSINDKRGKIINTRMYIHAHNELNKNTHRKDGSFSTFDNGYFIENTTAIKYYFIKQSGVYLFDEEEAVSNISNGNGVAMLRPMTWPAIFHRDEYFELMTHSHPVKSTGTAINFRIPINKTIFRS